jgi:CRISPR-associated protein Cmr1
MTTITATFHVTTPVFLGGADATTAELRAASLKGVLRFWWRACAWSRFPGTPDDRLAAIRAEEEWIFGGPKTGQSRVTLRVTDTGPVLLGPPEVLPGATGGQAAGARYLGYGLMHTAASRQTGARPAQLVRGCLLPGFNVAVELRLRDLREDQTTLVVNALRALGAIGGVGARSRRGYGSLSLRSIEGHTHAATRLEDVLTALHPKGQSELPPYTAFSPASRVLIGPAAPAMKALNDLGQQYKTFRMGLTDDTEIVRRTKDSYPDRAAFGLPVNFEFKKPRDKISVRPASPDHDRRASPLFFHMHEHGRHVRPVVAFLPAQFLPENAIVFAREKGWRSRPQQLPNADRLYEPVHQFLDELVESGGYEEVPVG